MNAFLLGYTGEYQDPVTGGYLLGNGYRPYAQSYMRFISPDEGFSPFGRGGINPYAYCLDDPINHLDPSGHFSWGKFLRIAGTVLGGVGSVSLALLLAPETGGASIGFVIAMAGVVSSGVSAGASVVETATNNPDLARIMGYVQLGTMVASVAAVPLAAGAERLTAYIGERLVARAALRAEELNSIDVWATEASTSSRAVTGSAAEEASAPTSRAVESEGNEEASAAFVNDLKEPSGSGISRSNVGRAITTLRNSKVTKVAGYGGNITGSILGVIGAQIEPPQEAINPLIKELSVGGNIDMQNPYDPSSYENPYLSPYLHGNPYYSSPI